MAEALETWNALSSTGLVGEFITFFENVGKWSGAASKLIGLAS
ncbi:porin [Corynebacterium cystitidis]|nr:porin [Corynebacterium cystitidis]